MASDFLKTHTKPKMLAWMGGLGYLGFMLAGPLGAAAGAYAGHLAGKPSLPEQAKDAAKAGLAKKYPGKKFYLTALAPYEEDGKQYVVVNVSESPGGEATLQLYATFKDGTLVQLREA